jgi:hypothetical protein
LAGFQELGPSTCGDVPLHLAADLQGLDLDLRAYQPALADDQRLAADKLSLQMPVHSNCAAEAQFPLEVGAFPKKVVDLADVQSERAAAIFSSPFYLCCLGPLSPFPLASV